VRTRARLLPQVQRHGRGEGTSTVPERARIDVGPSVPYRVSFQPSGGRAAVARRSRPSPAKVIWCGREVERVVLIAYDAIPPPPPMPTLLPF